MWAAAAPVPAADVDAAELEEAAEKDEAEVRSGLADAAFALLPAFPKEERPAVPVDDVEMPSVRGAREVGAEPCACCEDAEVDEEFAEKENEVEAEVETVADGPLMIAEPEDPGRVSVDDDVEGRDDVDVGLTSTTDSGADAFIEEAEEPERLISAGTEEAAFEEVGAEGGWRKGESQAGSLCARLTSITTLVPFAA